MKIGIIGTGHIGGTLATLWTKAGHEVMMSSRHPDALKSLAKKLGPKAHVGSCEEAARFGEVVLLSIPLGEIPNLSPAILNSLKGKIIIDTCNPYPDRDGDAGIEALKDPKGSGVWVAHHIPGAIVVKAFNAIFAQALSSEGHRHDPIGIPLASDNAHALDLVSKLVQEAGFGPFKVGELKRAKEFDNGTPPYGSGATVHELQEMLGHKVKK